MIGDNVWVCCIANLLETGINASIKIARIVISNIRIL